jgi:hypothetical protein
MIRRILLLGSMGVAALATAPAAMATPGGGVCQLDGSASFSKGLGTTPQDFQYSFSGTLSGCQSSPGQPAVTGGDVSAGRTITIGGVTYQEPIGTGNGSCASSTTAGTAFVQWAGGGLTIVSYSTTGAAALVGLTGSVLDSITLPVVNPAPGAPTTGTLTTTAFKGYSAGGPLAFEPPSPADCSTPTGVTVAGIQGALGLGSQS